MKIYICDFNDSFTYNIYSELKEFISEAQIEVISYNRLQSFLQVAQSFQEKVVIILGPGPGHPGDYQQINNSLLKLKDMENIFLMGICLGHQLILNLMGFEVGHANKALHGQVVRYNIDKSLRTTLGLNKELSVQRYNSLAVKEDAEKVKALTQSGHKFLIVEKEIIIMSCDNVLTYQFHPESIGTKDPNSYFGPVLNFLL